MGAVCSGISREPELAATEADNMREPQLVRAMSSLNVPAIAAAHVIRSHVAQGPDELSLEVGDIVCIVDMPPKEMSPFWRGKRGFEVGFFPGECVELIRGKLPESILHSLPKPEPKKRGKFISCLRSLLKACPRRAKQPEPPTFSGSMSLLDIVERMSSPSKRAESAACSWRSCFCLGKPSPVAKRQLQSSAREPSEAEVLVLAGDPSPCISPRRQACYDAASCDSINEELLLSTGCCSSDESLPYNISYKEKNAIIVEALVHPIPVEAADLSLPDSSGTSLNRVPFEDSPAQAQHECPDSSTTMQAQVSITEEKPNILEGEVESGQESQAPGNSTTSETLSSDNRE